MYEKKICLNRTNRELIRECSQMLINFMIDSLEKEDGEIDYFELRLKDPEIFSHNERDLRLRWVTRK